MTLDWDDVRHVLAVARAGSLAGAARASGVDQTTVGRRVAAFEERIGARLFERRSSGYALTAAGQRVVEAARVMEAAAAEVEARALGEDERLAGTVRIATTESLAEHFVAPALARVRAAHPAIDAVILTSWHTVNLVDREADVAVRLLRPTDPRLLGRRLASFALRLYAAPAYLAARGAPEGGLAGHDSHRLRRRRRRGRAPAVLRRAARRRARRAADQQQRRAGARRRGRPRHRRATVLRRRRPPGPRARAPEPRDAVRRVARPAPRPAPHGPRAGDLRRHRRVLRQQHETATTRLIAGLGTAPRTASVSERPNRALAIIIDAP
ncbi:MAG: LysR family transcriptional regulator [Minicystis sp.]